MSFLWFIVAVTFFILWLGARSGDKQSRGSDEYGQGYWDGYRAFGDKVAELLGAGAATTHKLRRLIDEGNGGGSATSTPREEQVGIIPEGTDEYVDDLLALPRTYAAETTAPQPVLTAEELVARKEKETMQNLNILLYVGSFLIVAAAALFVTLVMPAGVKLFSLILVTTAFYLSGLTLHARSTRLRPAATAFVGTGLAILPFVGFALTSLGGMSGEVAWLITSLVGLVAYAVAAIRLQSELVSYLTMAFVLSLALSAVSTLGLSIVWYFIATIGVSLVCNSLHILWARALPKIFAKPIEQTGQFTTPIALVASLFVVNDMDLFMYEVLYGIATAHYLVVWLEQRTRVYEIIVRVLAHVTLLIVAADVSNLETYAVDARVQFGVWTLVLAVLQALYSFVRMQQHGQESRQTEQLFVAGALVLVVGGMCWWADVDHAWWWAALSLTVAGVLSLVATIRFHVAGWAYVGLGASVVLPFVVGRGAMEPQLSYGVIAGGFTVVALLALMGLDRARALGKSAAANMLAVAVCVYSLMVSLSGALSGDGVTLGWTTLVSAGLFVVVSYVLRAVAMESIAAIFGIISVAVWVHESSIAAIWQLVATITAATGLLVAGAWIHHFNGERDRRNSLVAIGALLFAGLVFVAVDSYDVAVLRAATLLLLAASLATLGVRSVLRKSKSTLQQISQVAYFAYPLLALFVAWQAGAGWAALVWIVYSGIFWIGSYIEKQPALLVAGNVTLMCALHTLWSWLEFDPSWRLHGTAWIGAAVFYATYWLMVDKRDEWRQWISLISVWVVLGFAAMVHIWFGETQLVLASVGSLLAGSVALGIHGYRVARPGYIEAAIYIATFAVQRMVGLLIPETNLVVYGHWWALTIGLVAWWRRGDYTLRAVVALACVTGSTGIYALMGMAGYPLVFLVEHLIVLLAGAVLRKSWVMWWGVVSVVVAVLYFLRDYTFLAPLFLGILLIMFVVWRLTKVGKH